MRPGKIILIFWFIFTSFHFLTFFYNSNKIFGFKQFLAWYFWKIYLKSVNIEFITFNLYSMKIKEQTRKLAAGCTWVRQGDADMVWRDFWWVLDCNYSETKNLPLKNESGTEIGNSLDFDFVVPPPHSWVGL